MKPLNVKQMTFSAMERFIQAVDTVMNADDLTAKERQELIGQWAYQYARKDMPDQLQAAIKRCQAGEFIHPNASTVINNVTGEVIAYSSPAYN